LRRTGVTAGKDHLHGNQPLQRNLPGLVNDPHAAAAQLLENFETGDAGQFSRSHRHWRFVVRRPPQQFVQRCQASDLSFQRVEQIWTVAAQRFGGDRRAALQQLFVLKQYLVQTCLRDTGNWLYSAIRSLRSRRRADSQRRLIVGTETSKRAAASACGNS